MEVLGPGSYFWGPGSQVPGPTWIFWSPTSWVPPRHFGVPGPAVPSVDVPGPGSQCQHNMRNFFLEKSCAKYGGETIPIPFAKKSELSIYLDQQSEILQFVFIVCHAEVYQNILKLICGPLSFTLKLFFKKKSSETSHPTSFSTWFSKKDISLVMFYYLTIFHWLVAFISRDIGQYVYYNCSFTRLWYHKFWYQLYLSNQAVFSMTKKSRQKFRYPKNEKNF